MKTNPFPSGLARMTAATLVLFFTCCAAAQQDMDPSIGAGFKAGFMCSAVFVAGRDPADVLREEFSGVNPAMMAGPNPVVDYGRKAVTCAYADGQPPRLAVYWDGFGTVLMPPGATLEDAQNLPRISIPVLSGDPAKIPWPDGDLAPETPAPPEVDAAKLEAAVEMAFAESPDRPMFTIGAVVVYKGRIIAERYAPGWNMHTQYRTWSTAKSVTHALVGIMVREGKLDVNAPAPIPEWQGVDDPRKAITLDHLMHMSSGLVSEGAWTLPAYWGGIDVGADIVSRLLEAEPGTRWKYANYDTLLLMRSIRNVLADDTAYWTLPRRELFNKIGMRDTVMEIGPYGNFISSSQIYTTSRDLARFGLLYLNDGVWNGERILPKGWVEYARAPAPAKQGADGKPGDYGAQFWLYNNEPRLPADTFSTAGARGQYATIVPSRGVVVTRMGLDPLEGESGWSQRRFVADVLEAIRPASAEE